MLPREHYLKQSFADSVHFPNGFEKGGLSDIQARLVRKNGTLVNALCADEVSDPTPEDLHILKVVANQSSPKNPVEQAWMKYLSLVKSMSATTPKGKSKAKAAKVIVEEPTPEPVKPVTKTEKPAKAAEKVSPTPKAAVKEVVKKAEPTPVVEAKTKPAAKKEKVAPVATKAPTKAVAKKVEAPAKKEVKAETKVVAKAEPKKVEAKKAEPKKAAPKKAEPKVDAKKPAAKKPGKAK
ncbi:MAG: hypothetical protein EOO03_13385 [Chitinophagaceae bacterium]|nr:MAG: hypothetical protein EOO03_13385 [Chitinophagaceae bacterium]